MEDYFGITLTLVTAKLYARMLLNRIDEWELNTLLNALLYPQHAVIGQS